MRREETHPEFVQEPMEKRPLGSLIRKVMGRFDMYVKEIKEWRRKNGLGTNATMDFGNSDVETVGSTVTQPYS
jgi:hypothetical protein